MRAAEKRLLFAALYGADNTRIEWRAVGDPGDGYPPYSFVFKGEAEARGFVALAETNGPWLDGPHLEFRAVAETLWVRP